MAISNSHTPAPLDSHSFRAIAQLAYKESGLILVEEKSSMIQSRLRHRLQALGLAEYQEYCNFVQSNEGQDERRQLISALTTNVSHFFREEHHFEKLREHLSALDTPTKGKSPVRLWSAGCSNGQEPLTIAMTVQEHLPALAQGDFRLLATDIDPVVLQFAKQGIYPERLIGGAPKALRTKYFDEVTEVGGDKAYAAKPALRELIRYNELNLLGAWPIKAKFDAIFCRNVVIYFDTKTQDALWPRFKDALGPNGLLFLGHSERIAKPEQFGFECIGPTTYRPLSV